LADATAGSILGFRHFCQMTKVAKTGNSPMPRYAFELRFACPWEITDAPFVLEQFARIGCTDVVVRPAKAGRVVVGFDRVDSSARRALRGAIEAAATALPMARLVEASPDVVGYVEMAAIARISRQNLRHASMHDPSFPIALHEGRVDLYHLDDVLVWVQRRQHRRVSVPLLELAGATRADNLERQQRSQRRDPRLRPGWADP
jgi:hypothetical protein